MALYHRTIKRGVTTYSCSMQAKTIGEAIDQELKYLDKQNRLAQIVMIEIYLRN